MRKMHIEIIVYWKNRKSNVEQAAQMQGPLEPWQRITGVLGKEVPNFRGVRPPECYIIL